MPPLEVASASVPKSTITDTTAVIQWAYTVPLDGIARCRIDYGLYYRVIDEFHSGNTSYKVRQIYNEMIYSGDIVI